MFVLRSTIPVHIDWDIDSNNSHYKCEVGDSRKGKFLTLNSIYNSTFISTVAQW